MYIIRFEKVYFNFKKYIKLTLCKKSNRLIIFKKQVVKIVYILDSNRNKYFLKDYINRNNYAYVKTKYNQEKTVVMPSMYTIFYFMNICLKSYCL